MHDLDYENKTFVTTSLFYRFSFYAEVHIAAKFSLTLISRIKMIKIAYILSRCTAQSDKKTIKELINTTEQGELLETRLKIFAQSIGLIVETGNPDACKYKLKQRRGAKAAANMALDIVKLFKFLSNIDSTFPLNVLVNDGLPLATLSPVRREEVDCVHDTPSSFSSGADEQSPILQESQDLSCAQRVNVGSISSIPSLPWRDDEITRLQTHIADLNAARSSPVLDAAGGSLKVPADAIGLGFPSPPESRPPSVVSTSEADTSSVLSDSFSDIFGLDTLRNAEPNANSGLVDIPSICNGNTGNGTAALDGGCAAADTAACDNSTVQPPTGSDREAARDDEMVYM